MNIFIGPVGLGGLMGLAALVQMSAASPKNLIAFEYPIRQLPEPIDNPRLSVELNRRLRESISQTETTP